MENFFVSLVSGAVGGIILLLVVNLLNRPNLIISDQQWRRRKWVTNSFTEPIQQKQITVNGRYYQFYGITILNQPRWFSLPTADITSTTMKVWDSNGQIVAGERQCRWWTVDHASIDPLFVGNKAEIDSRRRRTIGISAEESLVLFCHAETETIYYRFSIESDTLGAFPNSTEKIMGIMPYYALIKIKGGNVKEDIYLLIQAENNIRDLSIQKIVKFPFLVN